jgi:Tfp pilus assembly protein PilN
VEDLRKEKKALQESIMLLKGEKAQLEQSDSQLDRIKKKEMDLAEVWCRPRDYPS